MKEKEKTALIKERFDVAVGGLTQGITIITDKKTGVQYLAIANSGTAVIVDKDGKPLLSEQVDGDQKETSPF
ncbi:DUF6440 family protein [Lactococcus paracarnosus]|uniref:DUF6440 domain-containing protein n=1 Tax=Pseudolactococcus paracarnosus TaxID=2749962 RepID=A0ABT0AJ40_9LACT|nr:DUF6440 family protein [Lactococcus paracarnosus]MCJ1976574.1 hypothetical protein [Lactococcus paracarnosus]MCJ1982635.1 hypothetical protein [Lactococcus paracarnosus]MCJ1997585.1 hypothetical protein [Lactococcus paracarnosus]